MSLKSTSIIFGELVKTRQNYIRIPRIFGHPSPPCRPKATREVFTKNLTVKSWIDEEPESLCVESVLDTYFIRSVESWFDVDNLRKIVLPQYHGPGREGN